MRVLKFPLMSLLLVACLTTTSLMAQESADDGQESAAEPTMAVENSVAGGEDVAPTDEAASLEGTEDSAADNPTEAATAAASEGAESASMKSTAEAVAANQRDPFRSVRFMWAAYTAFFLILFAFIWNLGRRQKRLVEEVRHLRRGLATYDIDNQVNQA